MNSKKAISWYYVDSRCWQGIVNHDPRSGRGSSSRSFFIRDPRSGRVSRNHFIFFLFFFYPSSFSTARIASVHPGAPSTWLAPSVPWLPLPATAPQPPPAASFFFKKSLKKQNLFFQKKFFFQKFFFQKKSKQFFLYIFLALQHLYYMAPMWPFILTT